MLLIVVGGLALLLFGSPFSSGIQVPASPIIVTFWVKHPAQNHGFILYPDLPGMDYYFYSGAEDQYCFAYLGGFQLEILYFTPLLPSSHEKNLWEAILGPSAGFRRAQTPLGGAGNRGSY